MEVIYFVIFSKGTRTNLPLLLMNLTEPKNERMMIDHLEGDLWLISNMKISRKANFVLKAYISKFEIKCTDKNCYLKQFLQSSDQSEFFLFKHLETIFQTFLSKYPNSFQMRLQCIRFLFEQLNNQKKAQRELEKISHFDSLSILESFKIYQVNKIIDTKTCCFATISLYDLQASNLKSTIKTNINQVVLNYLTFWNLLLTSSKDINHDLKYLSTLGNTISTLNSQIRSDYQKYLKINSVDKEINNLTLYMKMTS